MSLPSRHLAGLFASLAALVLFATCSASGVGDVLNGRSLGSGGGAGGAGGAGGTGGGAGGPSCTDGVKNGTETDVDCGGSCTPCEDLFSCTVPADCLSGRCTQGTCDAPPFSSVCAGLDYGCGLTTQGAVWCWGEGLVGQLGDGSGVGHSFPRLVSGLSSGATAVTCGLDHVCALQRGTLKCWGSNLVNQLGEGSTQTSEPKPVSLPLQGVKQVSAGGFFTCAVLTSGGVKCWGARSHANLGDGLTSGSSVATPVDVVTVSDATQVATGDQHACALTTSGAVWCWGDNTDGQIGNGQDQSTAGACHCSQTPTQVIRAGMQAIAAGGSSTCALDGSGRVSCWGKNDSGQLSGGGLAGAHVKQPTLVSSLSGVTSVSVGAKRTCAVANGVVRCAGANELGGVGAGTTTGPDACGQGFACSTGFVEVVLPNAVQVAVGTDTSCAVDSSSSAFCWGSDFFGQLGYGRPTARSRVVPVKGLPAAQALDLGRRGGCALTTDGGVKCWGTDIHGELGAGRSRAAPNVFAAVPVATDVAGLTGGVVGLSVSPQNACALTSTGAVRCWGANQVGQLGLGQNAGPQRCGDVRDDVSMWSRGCSPTPVTVLPSSATQVCTGDVFGCALTTSGSVACWGSAASGSLGNGITQSSPGYSAQGYRPQAVSGLGGGVTAVACGADFACALTAAGGVKCWGSNAKWSLGAPGPDQAYPQAVPGLSSGVRSLVAGGGSACALLGTGEVQCWGGALANHPSAVTGFSSAVQALSMDDATVCARLSDDSQWCAEIDDQGSLEASAVTKAQGAQVLRTGSAHWCTLGPSGEVKCWGDTTYGAVGDGFVAAEGVPHRVE